MLETAAANAEQPEFLSGTASATVEIWSIEDYCTKFAGQTTSGTFRLMTDLEISGVNCAGGNDVVTVDGEITLDLNGHTLSMGIINSKGGELSFSGSGRVLLKNGTIVTRDNKPRSGDYSIVDSISLIADPNMSLEFSMDSVVVKGVGVGATINVWQCVGRIAEAVPGPGPELRIPGSLGSL